MEVPGSSQWQPQISPADGFTPRSMMSPPIASYLHGTLDGVANLLGMSTHDLRTALKHGASIAEVAAGKGVDRGSVVSFLERAVQQRRAADGQVPLDPQALAQVVERAVERQRGAQAAHHPGQHRLRTPIVAKPYGLTDPALNRGTVDVLA